MKIKDFDKARKTFRNQTSIDARNAEINFQDVFDAAEIFEEDPNSGNDKWVITRTFIDWKNLHNLPTSEVVEKAVRFLDYWGCYLYTQRENWDKMAENIKNAYRNSIPFLQALENETLEDIDLTEKKTVEGKEYSNEEILRRVFENFCNVGYNFRGVAASKVLSLINPYLFVMWDQGICKEYGIKGYSEPYVRDNRYVSEFFPIMKEKANLVIESCMKENRCTRKEAIDMINNFRKYRPLAKLLDEYNWITFVVDKR